MTPFRFAVLLALFFGVFTSKASADYYVYNVICETTQSEDVARVIKAKIYLALKADPTVANSTISVTVKKVPALVEIKHEEELLQGLGYYFNPSDLSFSAGGDATGHACFRNAFASIAITVLRKNGTTAVNRFVTPIRVPGAYATKAKLKIKN